MRASLLLAWLLVWLLELHLASPLAVPLDTAAGQPISPYILGGAARSAQPRSLPKLYREILSESEAAAASATAAAGSPAFFAYNPHRYPAFMQGIRDVASEVDREGIFLMSGGGERSEGEMDARLDDAIELMGAGSYLDAFILEVGSATSGAQYNRRTAHASSTYPHSLTHTHPHPQYVCPDELGDDSLPGSALAAALAQARRWQEQGRVRYVGLSSHSHAVAAALSKFTDITMLRYNMGHRLAAEATSLPAAAAVEGNTALSFCSTRWNKLQEGHADWTEGEPPSSADCLSFALSHPSVGESELLLEPWAIEWPCQCTTTLTPDLPYM